MSHDRYRKGGLHDDVAQNIRAQQMADAMPSPEEAKADHQRWLADEGCSTPGCKVSDPADLRTIYPFTPTCPRQQAPEPDVDVRCNDHQYDPKLRYVERMTRVADDSETTLVLFECHWWAKATEPDVEDDLEEFGSVPPWVDTRPTVPVECECGAGIKHIIYPNTENEESQ